MRTVALLALLCVVPFSGCSTRNARDRASSPPETAGQPFKIAVHQGKVESYYIIRHADGSLFAVMSYNDKEITSLSFSNQNAIYNFQRDQGRSNPKFPQFDEWSLKSIMTGGVSWMHGVPATVVVFSDDAGTGATKYIFFSRSREVIDVEEVIASEVHKIDFDIP